VPMGLLYTGAALFFAHRWLTAHNPHSHRSLVQHPG
jgi:putative membrane protein